jgi:hypothetical protein
MGNKRNVECEVENMQGKRLILNSPEAVRESTFVSVEYEDTLLLGEVVICSGSRDNWKVEIRLEQILTGLQSLMALRASLLNENFAAPLPLMPLGMRN